MGGRVGCQNINKNQEELDNNAVNNNNNNENVNENDQPERRVGNPQNNDNGKTNLKFKTSRIL